MKKLQIAFLSGILLSLFSITSCNPGADPVLTPVLPAETPATPTTTNDPETPTTPNTPANPATPSDENTVTVTFNNNGTILRTSSVTSGSTLSASQKPSDPYSSYNYFLYWSESKASKATKATAVEYDFNNPISENKTLYAIYTPRFYYTSSSIIQSVTASQAEIKLYGDTVYPLEDGSYAGISFQHSTDGTNYQDFAVNSIPDYRDENGYRYLTYTFQTALSEGTHYLKVTNGHQTGTKSAGIYAPAAVTNLSATVADSYTKVSFTTATEGYSYTVKAFKNGNEVASTDVTANSINTNTYAEFFGLENGTPYTFKVITNGTNLSAETTATPAITRKTSDWLVVMYMDGDNNLNDPIFMDMNEVEHGLYQIRNSNGSSVSGFDSVNVVALWDGASSFENPDGSTGTPQIGNAGTYIYELGRDYDNSTTYTTSPGCVLSSDTKNLSYTAPWLVGTSQTVSTSLPNNTHGELNMGDKQTLINFLNWVNARYTATKGVILQFSNHGGGPRSVMYAEDAEGRTYKIGDDSGRRALCWDDSAGSNQFLKTKDVSDALTTAGFTGTNKLSMILMDVCLGSSLEDAYQFRNNADYLAASPNNIPGSGLDYYAFMKAFSKNTTIEAIGSQIIIDYKNQYTATSIRDLLWNTYAQNAYGATYSNLTADQKEALEWFGDLGMTTFTITDLSKVANIKDKLDDLCNILLSDTGKAKTIYVGDDGYFSPTATSKTENYVKYLGSQHADRLSQKYVNNSIYYLGSFTWLYDIGYFADRVKLTSTSTLNVNGVSTPNANAWSELYSAADKLLSALGTGSDRAIRYSWRDSKLNTASNYDFYYRQDNNSAYQHPYGLSIAGYGIAVNAGRLVKGTVPSWYKTDLAFGADSKWGDLLAYWFNN